MYSVIISPMQGKRKEEVDVVNIDMLALQPYEHSTSLLSPVPSKHHKQDIEELRMFAF